MSSSQYQYKVFKYSQLGILMHQLKIILLADHTLASVCNAAGDGFHKDA